MTVQNRSFYSGINHSGRKNNTALRFSSEMFLGCLAIRKLRNVRFTSNAPLSGIRVLDLSRVLAGPFTSMLLTDLGAEVIKVEKPGWGDDTRHWGPPFVEGESTYYLSINRNKKSVAVNLKSKEGIEILKKLASKSDILIENFLPGKLAQMGLGYEELKKKTPSLIYCSITGYGPGGPCGHRKGYDLIAAGVGGLMHITGPEGGEPCGVGVASTDLSTGLFAHGAIMAALLERHRTGMGKKIDCSLLSTQVAILTHVAAAYLNAGVEGERFGTAHHNIVPYQAFKTSDGYINFGVGNDALFKKFCELLHLDHLVADPRFARNSDRIKNRKELILALTERIMEKSTEEWLHVFEGSGIPYGPINTIKQVFEDPQVQYKKLALKIDHPTVGALRVSGPAVEYNGERYLVDPKPPPALGQHTEEVLKNVLGYGDSDIESFVRSGAIEIPDK